MILLSSRKMYIAIILLLCLSCVHSQWSWNSQCGFCYCSPPPVLCSGLRISELPYLGINILEATTTLRVINTYISQLHLKYFLNLKRLDVQNNTRLSCRTLRKQIEDHLPNVVITSDCFPKLSLQKKRHRRRTSTAINNQHFIYVQQYTVPTTSQKKINGRRVFAITVSVLATALAGLTLGLVLFLCKKTASH